MQLTFRKGHYVQLIFKAPKNKKGAEVEYMWVKILRHLKNGTIVGRLDNEPTLFKKLKINRQIKFTKFQWRKYTGIRSEEIVFNTDDPETIKGYK